MNISSNQTNTLRNAVFAVAAALGTVVPAWGEKPFAENFSDSTLRIDYIIGRGPDGTVILVDGQTKTPGWYGRRHRLAEVPLEGNGSVTVTEPATGDTLYRHTFSTLYQEWLGTPEAQDCPQSFENSFLVPLPLRDADITLTLNTMRREPMASVTHRYRPADELVAIGGKTPYETRTLHRGGNPEEAIDVAILAEGYTASEKGEFFNHAEKYAAEILRYEPFASHKDKFNFVAVAVESPESGVSVPLEGKWKDTPFRSHFSTFHSPRYLTAPGVKAMHKALEGVPYEHLIVLVNTPIYGGGGIYNSYTTASALNEMALPVVVHEFGHSFGGLADEYFYDSEENDIYFTDIEPWEPNITTLVDFDGKWKGMLSPGTPVPTPWKEEKGDRAAKMKKGADKARNADGSNSEATGVYEGGGYKAKGVYRPAVTCRMRDNYNPTFCPVCRKALADVIGFYTGKAE